jgi:hypothetical protein
VEVGKDGLPVPEHGHFLRLGLFHLDDHLGLAIDLVGAGGQAGPLAEIVVVGQPGAFAGAGLDDHLVPGADHLLHAHRQHPHSILMVLDLARHSDNHGDPPEIAETLRRRRKQTTPQPNDSARL